MSSPLLRLLPYLFDTTARLHADRIALDLPPCSTQPVRQRLRYDELHCRASAVSAALRPLVGRDSIVALLLRRNSPHLYASQLGVLAAGAAFTALDPTAPTAYLRSILEDCQPVALVSESGDLQRLAGLSGRWTVLDPSRLTASEPLSPVSTIQPGDLAYVIYTSGTTGSPKGVLIEHRSIANLVCANIDYFRLGPEDRVAQCSSPAYDSSLEEMWLAFSVGGTLVPLDDTVVRLGPDLVDWLQRERIHVLCPPPTLLRSMACPDPRQQLPDLRLLYVGGEALSSDLADRWGAGRWLENGYGPTECTVTVVRGRVRPGEPVTIGKPVAGHRAWVVDENLQEVADGEEGELCLAGVGLARGYHRREELTAQRFPTHPQFGRIYRSGDLVRRGADGRLVYLGRIDSQVKLRGHRIELEAIEALLSDGSEVLAAACRVQQEADRQLLVAHLVPQGASSPTLEDIRRRLARHLPEHMLPARLVLRSSLPTTPGGKLDRQALPDIPAPAKKSDGCPPRQDFAGQISAIFADVLGLDGALCEQADFFLDLGGDSISAVAVVCRLRAAGHHSVTVREIYETRTARALADNLRQRGDQPLPTPPTAANHRPRVRPLVCTLAQTTWLTLEVALAGLATTILVFLLLPTVLTLTGLTGTVLVAGLLPLIALGLWLPLSVLLVVLAKKLLIGRYSAGRHPVWGMFYLRHWIVSHLASLIPWWLFEQTVLTGVVLRSLGAQVGRRVLLHRSVDLAQGGWDLLCLGDEVTVAQDAELGVVRLHRGELILGPIHLGAGATLDVRAGLSPGARVEAGGYLTPLSWLPGDAVLPAGERWDGVPARPAGQAPPPPPVQTGLTPGWHAALLILARLLIPALLLFPLVGLALLLETHLPASNELILAWLREPALSGFAALLLLLASSFWLAGALVFRASLARWMGTVGPGCYSAWSLQGIRIGLKIAAVNWANRWLSGSLFWPWWLRLAGMRVGRGCEISTIIESVPETIQIGEWSFFADGIYLCPPWRYRGRIVVGENYLGEGTFLGNHAVIPGGHTWPADLFVGVATVPDPAQVSVGSAWFGHPPLQLPRREQVQVDRRLTHHPDTLRIANRLFWETLRLALPWWPLVVFYAWYVALAEVAGWGNIDQLLLAGPLAGLGATVALCAALVALKWLLLGAVRPGQHPLWSCWCSRWDFVYVAWTVWAQAALARLEGTLLLNSFLRLMGVQLGRRVILGPGFSQVVDPDLITIEEDATVSGHFQAHTFEDRVLKRDRVRIGRGATVGSNAVIFLGADVGEEATVAPHAVVMKYEHLEARLDYEGSPTRPVC